MMGHISSAYSARVSRDLSLSTRFDFNVYSYESEWTMGAEWWIRRPRTGVVSDAPSDSRTPAKSSPHRDEVNAVVKARASTNNVRTSPADLYLY
jgi:distribution and morphology protein 10